MRSNDDGAKGVLLVGHGTRELSGVTEFLATAQLVAQLLPDRPVEACFLELARPDIPTALAHLAARGARRATVAPLLLFSAGHAKSDIPRAAEEAARPLEMELDHAAPMGWHPLVLELSAERFRQATHRLRDFSPERGALVMVGRGSSDSEATLSMRRFAALRRELTPVARMEVGFVAVAEPPVETAIERALTPGIDQVVVQPHLLFQGELMLGLKRLVATMEKRYANLEWIVADHLGPCESLAAAVVERVREVDSP